MRIEVVGGGPAGLFFALLAKRANPDHEVTVHERNRPDDTFGFGVVFSEKTMDYLREQDETTYREISANSLRWDPIETRIHGGVLACGGIGFWAISRKRLLNVLQRGAAAAGVDLRFQAEVVDPLALAAESDLVAVSDGINSGVRTRLAEHFKPRFEVGKTRFTWFGAAKRFPSFTFLFEENEHGRFCAHIYPYEEGLSTFIVETDEDTWRRAGLEESNLQASAPGQSDLFGLEYCRVLFAGHLDGQPLLANNSKWAAFRTVRNGTWRHRNLVLMGDAAHTAHFSVGSGTKMAMEDAIALARFVGLHGNDVGGATAAYEAERRPRVEHIQDASRPSLRWYEQFRHYWSFPTEKFAFHFLTRSNYDYGQLKERDPSFVAAVESREAFDPTRVIPAERITEMVAVRPDGRVHPGTPLALDGAVAGTILQVGHAGRRASTRSPQVGRDLPLRKDGWEVVAPSALAYGPWSQVPRALQTDEMEEIRGAFVSAARGGAAAGFETLLLQFGRGYLLHSFLSPLANAREDGYGGSAAGRLRYPLEVLASVREAWKGTLWVALSMNDWAPGGNDDDQCLETAWALRAAGADLLLVESGWVSARSIPAFGRCFNAQFSDRVKNEVGIPTAVAGGILTADDARNVLLAGRADYVIADPGYRA